MQFQIFPVMGKIYNLLQMNFLGVGKWFLSLFHERYK